MEFEFAHDFRAPASALAGALLDEDFQASLSDIGALKERRVLSQEERSDGRVVRRVRCVLDVQLNDMARSFIGGGDPAWVEESVWEPASMRWDWVIHPEVAQNMLSASGDIRIDGDDNLSLRVVSGSVRVHNIPFYGGKVERFIVDGIRAAYDQEAERLQAYLAT